MAQNSQRILVTPSSYTKSHYLYVQEVGTLKIIDSHISKRENLESYLFFIVTEGSGTVTFRGTKHLVKTGDCVFLNCLESYSHESSISDPWSLMWVHFNGVEAHNFYKLYDEKEGPVTYTPASPSPYISCLTALYKLQQQKDALSDLLSHKHLTELVAQVFSDTFRQSTEASVPEKFTDIRRYIEEHYTEKITLDDLAERFYISKYHLLREYQRFFGTTINGDLTLKRLSEAKSMLRFTSESIENIALVNGFQTASYFIKVFKRYESMTPLEYRQKW